MFLAILFLTLGAALSFVIPSGVKPGTKYRRPTETDFEAMLVARGLK